MKMRFISIKGHVFHLKYLVSIKPQDLLSTYAIEVETTKRLMHVIYTTRDARDAQLRITQKDLV